jgi:3-polyprenyl-4-hydroxybenzoate decarboxylase
MSAPMVSDRKSRVLLGITGSVAAIKGPKLCLDLMSLGMDVQVVLTQGGAHFWNKAQDYDLASWMTLQSRIQARQLIVYCKSVIYIHLNGEK